MTAAIGDTLPLAMGIALSPFPVIAAILLLMAPGTHAAAVAFAAGWLLGILGPAVAFTLLAGVLPGTEEGGSRTVVGVVQILLGAGLLLLAGRQWRARPEAGEEPPLPGWMAAVDTMAPGKALGLAVVLAAANPKNLLLTAAAGVAVGDAALGGGATAAVLAAFTLVASATVLGPVAAYLAIADRLTGPLAGLRTWLVQHNAAIMAVLLLVLGTKVLGSGLGNL